MPRFRYVHDTFWSGRTGRALRGDHIAQAVAVYLMTCRHANQIGLYYLPIPVMAHEIGSPLQGASKGLRRVCELGFSHYDEESEWVFLPRMAYFQIGEILHERDKRRKGVLNQLSDAESSPYLSAFYEIYGECFRLGEFANREGASKGLRRGFELANGENVCPSKQETKRRQRGERDKERDKEDTNTLSLRFERVWVHVRNKRSRGDALKAFKAAVRSKSYPGDDGLVKALDEAWNLDWCKRPKSKVPYPATWLRAEGWLDEFEQSRPGWKQGDDGVWEEIPPEETT